MPMILSQGVKATKERVARFKNDLNEKINCFVNGGFKICDLNNSDDKIKSRHFENVENIKNGLIYLRQIEISLKFVVLIVP